MLGQNLGCRCLKNGKERGEPRVFTMNNERREVEMTCERPWDRLLSASVCTGSGAAAFAVHLPLLSSPISNPFGISTCLFFAVGKLQRLNLNYERFK